MAASRRQKASRRGSRRGRGGASGSPRRPRRRRDEEEAAEARGAAAGASSDLGPLDDEAAAPSPGRRVRLLVALAAVGAGAVVLLLLAARLTHSLDEIHGFYNHASRPWSHLLTTYTEPAHHVLFNILLKIGYPLLEGTRLELRWVTVLTALAFLPLFALMTERILRVTLREARTDRIAATLLWAVWLLLPLCFSYLLFYATQSRGYMLGLVCFGVFLDASVRVTDAPAPAWPWRWSLVAAAAGAASVAAVLSNATLILGAAAGLLLADALQRHKRIFVTRLATLAGVGLALALLHPAARDLSHTASFATTFGTQVRSVQQGLFVAALAGARFFEPAPYLLGLLGVLGIFALARQRWPVLLAMAAVVGVQVVWVVMTKNLMYARSYFGLYLVALVLVSAGMAFLVGAAGRRGRRRPWVARGAAGAALALVVALMVGGARHAVAEHGGWGAGFDARRLIAEEGEYDLDLIPWWGVHSYTWERGAGGVARLERLLRQRRVDRLRLFAERPLQLGSRRAPVAAQKDQLCLPERRGVQQGRRHRSCFHVDRERTRERVWSMRVESYLLAGGHLLGSWRSGAWEAPPTPASPGEIILLLYRCTRLSGVLKNVEASDELLWHRPGQVTEEGVQARVVLRSGDLESTLRQLQPDLDGPALVFAFPVPGGRANEPASRPVSPTTWPARASGGR